MGFAYCAPDQRVRCPSLRIYCNSARRTQRSGVQYEYLASAAASVRPVMLQLTFLHLLHLDDSLVAHGCLNNDSNSFLLAKQFRQLLTDISNRDLDIILGLASLCVE